MNQAGEPSTPAPSTRKLRDHLRFHRPNAHLANAFGNDQFALKAEAFARFFGTPTFLGAQTLIVVLWVAANAFGFSHFDVYPFILLNLAFSLQSAYAAPLILLAQTRQAARDKAQSEADAQHREDLAIAGEQRQALLEKNSEQLIALVEQNTRLTELTQQMAQRIEQLTTEMHGQVVAKH